MENKMAAELLVQGLSFQAQLEHNIEREEQVQAGLHCGKVERAVFLDELLGLGLPQAVNEEHTKRVALQNWEAQQTKAPQIPITPAWNNFQPPLLTQQDDIEAYLGTFERVAEACQWPREEWVTRLAPALNGNFQQVTHVLNACDVKDYEALKEAILKTHNITAETWRQRFRQFCYPEAKRPLEVCGQLRELCYQWLRPDTHTKEQILDLLILEQFLTILPKETQSWVRGQGPETCTQAVTLLEVFLLKQQEAKRWEGQELVTNSHEKQPDVSGSACQEDGQESGVDSSLQDVGMIPSEKGVQTPLKDKTDEPQRSLQAVHMGDLVQNRGQGRMGDGQVRAANDQNRLPSTMDKNISAAYHDLGHHKIQDTGVGTGTKSSITRQLSKNFGRQAELFRDKRMHPGDKPYQCTKCRRRFSESTALHQHLKSHSAEKRYQCTECEMRFRQSSDLIKHQRIHTGEKPYQCQECGKRFSLCSALYRHCRGHSGVKPFQCKECGKGFTRNSSLAQHHRLHKR
ncbi:zinc finger and SCAN domain-containing protein 23-like [Eublepharis macularius]|uniref:Zinc finger and SCAN domain-containing protein 23-like n=1 Tax=Eublepharis macularius TaxID=481883 RepID=A0AA97LJK5_EUBMA|nr:zinc finger and SCAN domain-containing protein 23-like [Eublepharis macularius]